MRKLLSLICFAFLTNNLLAQKDTNTVASKSPSPVQVNIGIGLGLDYGGIGAKLCVIPHKNIGMFAGVGYAFIGAGYNAGVTARLTPAQRFCPFISVMYGYNAAIKIENAESLNQLYYGPSFAVGAEVWGRSKKGFWNFELIIPVRSEEFNDDWDAIKNDPFIEIKQDILPIAFTIGYQIKL